MRLRLFQGLRASDRASDDGSADPGRDPFRGDHRRQDDDKDDRDLRPSEARQRGLELKPNAAGADKAENCRLANIDIPAEHGDAGKGGGDLQDHAKVHHLEARGAGGADRLYLRLIDLLDRLVEQLADEADGPQRDGDDAGEQPGAR
jgi:hypothetical protein